MQTRTSISRYDSACVSESESETLGEWSLFGRVLSHLAFEEGGFSLKRVDQLTDGLTRDASFAERASVDDS